MDTLEQVAEDVKTFVGPSGSCQGDPEVRTAINQARRLIWPLGNWKNLVNELAIQSYGGYITLPSAYDFVVHTWQSPRRMLIQNEWFVVVTTSPKDRGMRCKPMRVHEPVVTFRDFTNVNPQDCFFRLEAMYESNHDDGKVIKIHGYNKQGGRETLVRRSTGAFESIVNNENETQPYTDVYMRNLFQVEKPLTDGRIRLYGYLPDTDKRVLLSFFEKDDINPSLVRYRIGHGAHNRGQYLVSAKKRYRPLVNESDPVDIHTEALIHVLQAIQARENGELAKFNADMALATTFLQRELGQTEAFEQGRIHTTGNRVTNLIEDDGREPYYRLCP